jgi:hypothetical protein
MNLLKPLSRRTLQATAEAIQRQREQEQHRAAAASGERRELVARIPIQYAAEFGWTPHAAPDALDPPDAHTSMTMHRETVLEHQAQDAALRLEIWAALPDDLRRQVTTVLDEQRATARDIEQTRAAQEAHEQQVPQDRRDVAAWSSKRADLAMRVQTYEAIAEAQESRYQGLAWEVSQAAIALTERRIPPADAAVEKAEQEAQRLIEQAREVRRAARSQRDTLQRLITDADAHGIAIFAEVTDGR